MKKIILHSLIITFSLTIIISALLPLIIQFSITALSNTLTMASLFLLMVGMTIIILSSGTFDFFIYSFQRLRQHNNRSFQPKRENNHQTQKLAFLFLACALELLTLAILIFYCTH